MILINFFINPIQTEIIAGKDDARAQILFSVCSREYRNTEIVTTALQVIIQGYRSIETIGSVHLSESGTIAVFWGEKGENQLDEKGNVFNTSNQLLTCRIDIYSPFCPLSCP